MSSHHHRLLLWTAATDRTFRRKRTHDGRPVLEGKCIHCKRRLSLTVDGAPGPGTTLEHIVPRTHGGTNALENLAIACAGCNGGKGVRLDHRDWRDPTLQRVIETLRSRREARWREAPEGWELPPRPTRE